MARRQKKVAPKDKDFNLYLSSGLYKGHFGEIGLYKGQFLVRALQLSDTNWKESCSFLKRAHNCEQNQMLFASSGLLGEEISSLNLCQSLKRLVLAMPSQIFRVGETVFSKALETFGKKGFVTEAWQKRSTWFY